MPLLAVVSSEAIVGVFWDVPGIEQEKVILQPLWRRHVVIERPELALVEFERQWLPPFWMKTIVRFRLDDGSHVPKVVVPLWSRYLRSSFEALGWPVERRQLGAADGN